MFWFFFVYSVLILIVIALFFAVVDAIRRFIKPPKVASSLIYAEMCRPVNVNRYPFRFMANIAISENEIAIEPRYQYEKTGGSTLPKVVLDLKRISRVQVFEGDKFSVRIEYPQAEGKAIWQLGFEYPYSAYQCLKNDSVFEELNVIP